jgi:UDP-N-acetylmuramate--alanine ligase
VKLLKYSASKKADFYADNIYVQDSRVYFDFMDNDKIKQSIEYILPGEHNISNVVAAVAVSCSLGLEINKVAESIVNFLGIKRRFDIMINKEQLTYIDDYAHHPKEVTSTIEAVKQLFPERYITVVFQPHLFSRTQHLALEFAKSLSLADQLILLDIYAARESPVAGVNSDMLLDLCTNSKKETCRKQDLLELLNKEKIDVLLTLGAGDIGDLTQPIKHMLN